MDEKTPQKSEKKVLLLVRFEPTPPGIKIQRSDALARMAMATYMKFLQNFRLYSQCNFVILGQFLSFVDQQQTAEKIQRMFQRLLFMRFDVGYVNGRLLQPFWRKFKLFVNSLSKSCSFWTKQRLTRVQISSSSRLFFLFLHLFWAGLTKLRVKLPIETNNSTFWKIFSVPRNPLCKVLK